MQTLERRVRDALMGPCGVSPGETVIVAVSGGADSTALLHALVRIAGDCGLRVEAAHFEHGIRGEESLSDARFVRSLCARLNVPLREGNADVPRLSQSWKTGLEDAARRARFAFLRECARAAGARSVALAHHMQDQAETVLLHAVRGSDGRGLCAMRARNGLFVRPMLETRREEIRDYLRALDEAFCEDSTNASEEPARNRVRLQAMPALRTVNPRADEALCRVARAAQRDEAYFDAALDSLMPPVQQAPYGLCARLAPLREMHPALRSRALLRILWQAGVEQAPCERVEAADRVLCVGGACGLWGGWRMEAGWTHLHLLRPDFAPDPAFELPLQAALSGACLPWGGRLVPSPFTGRTGDGLLAQAFAADALAGAVVRYRRPGDVIRPFGSGGTQKLKQTMIDRRLDRPFRALVPLIARGSDVLWAVGVRAAEQSAVRADGADICLTFDGELPWMGETT